MNGRTQLKKPGQCLLQKQIRSFRKEGVAKWVKGSWNMEEDKNTNITVRFGNREATSEGDLDMGSLGVCAGRGDGYKLKGAG